MIETSTVLLESGMLRSGEEDMVVDSADNVDLVEGRTEIVTDPRFLLREDILHSCVNR